MLIKETTFSYAQTDNRSIMVEAWLQQRTDEEGVYIQKVQKTFSSISGQRRVENMNVKLNYVTLLRGFF